ncbi:MAG TPA: cytochrome c family protein [Stellaceae bacterium]|nr:cytochrome c family protein [Stellaceae bacterium]
MALHRRSILVALLCATISGPGHARADNLGEQVFKRNCALCHSTEPAKNKIGPTLAGILGRKAGTVPNFVYSESNRTSGITWNAESLDQYLIDPRKFLPGTKMVFTGLRSADDRRALIEYLATQK